MIEPLNNVEAAVVMTAIADEELKAAKIVATIVKADDAMKAVKIVAAMTVIKPIAAVKTVTAEIATIVTVAERLLVRYAFSFLEC
jgi:hypothetical protein